MQAHTGELGNHHGAVACYLGTVCQNAAHAELAAQADVVDVWAGAVDGVNCLDGYFRNRANDLRFVGTCHQGSGVQIGARNAGDCLVDLAVKGV